MKLSDIAPLRRQVHNVIAAGTSIAIIAVVNGLGTKLNTIFRQRL